MAYLDYTRWNGAPLAYRPGSDTECPDCGKSNWLVGRSTAECGYCAAALPLSSDSGHWIDLRRAA